VDLTAVVDQLHQLPADQARAFLDSLTVDERGAVNEAIDRAWLRDPSTFAATLTPATFKRWRYTDGTHPLQVWMVPARYGKSLIGSRWGPGWYLHQQPDRELILTSYGDDLARSNSAAVRDILDGYPTQLGPSIVRRDRSAIDRWNTTAGGQVLAAGVGSAMTGFGGHGIVVDDPFKNWEEAQSARRRDMVWDWFQSVVWLRRQTAQTWIIVIQTRWHEGDLIGRLLDPPDGGEPEDWHVVRMPAIAEEPRTDGPDWEQLPDPLGRQPGEVIEPERFPLSEVQARLRVLGSFKAAALEQQRPAAQEGAIIKRAWWRWYDTRPEWPDEWCITWDSAFKGIDTSDFCVGGVWCRKGPDIYLLDLIRDRMEYPEFKAAVVSLSRKWPEARSIVIEDSANGAAVIAELRRTIRGIIPWPVNSSKESRVHAAAPWIESGNVHLPNPAINNIDARVNRAFVNDFVDELAQFPQGQHDDQVDVTTMAIERLTGARSASAQRGRYRTTAGRR
jgi:predicted phage terminase large subunit-like protein